MKSLVGTESATYTKLTKKKKKMEIEQSPSDVTLAKRNERARNYAARNREKYAAKRIGRKHVRRIKKPKLSKICASTDETDKTTFGKMIAEKSKIRLEKHEMKYKEFQVITSPDRLTTKEFYKLTGEYQAKDLGELSKTYDNNTWQWFHAMIADGNLIEFITSGIFKYVASLCRCKKILANPLTKTLSEGHFHTHLLVAIESKTALLSWKKLRRRHGLPAFKKSTLKPILCKDHLCGVARYIACSDGQRIGKRDVDGIIQQPHTHYDRRVFNQFHIHQADPTGDCIYVRKNIEVMMKKGAVDPNKPLHDYETCKCWFGKEAVTKRANYRKRQLEFNATAEGKEMKSKYAKKKEAKLQLTALLESMGKGVMSDLIQGQIKNLLKLV